MPKLLCVVMDGLRTESLACAHVGCLDRLIRRGAVNRQLPPLRPNLIVPTLFSLFTSTLPEEHGVVTNSLASTVSPDAVSLFSLLHYRCLTSAAFYSDHRLRLAFPPGSLHTEMCINSQGVRNVDGTLAEHAGRHLQKEKPDFCLLCLQGAAIAGKHFGWSSDPYLDSIEQADQSLALLLEHLTEVGLREDYVLLVIGCHTESNQQGESVLADKNEIKLPLLLSGPGIQPGVEPTQPLCLLDVSPIMAKILGVAPHPDWRGRVVEELFRQPSLELVARSRHPWMRQLLSHEELAA